MLLKAATIGIDPAGSRAYLWLLTNLKSDVAYYFHYLAKV